MGRLNPLDAVFVDAEDEDRHTSMAIASIAVFEGAPPSHEEFLAFLAGRLPAVPRYRQKLRTVPLRLGRPVWVDDPEFDLRYHVRRTALPAAGSSLSGQFGQQRRCTWARTSLGEGKRVRRNLGGTVNDVVLAGISGGLRVVLLARGGQRFHRQLRSGRARPWCRARAWPSL